MKDKSIVEHYVINEDGKSYDVTMFINPDCYPESDFSDCTEWGDPLPEGTVWDYIVTETEG